MTGQQIVDEVLLDEEGRQNDIRLAAINQLDRESSDDLLCMIKNMDPDLFDRCAALVATCVWFRQPEVLIGMLHEIGPTA